MVVAGTPPTLLPRVFVSDVHIRGIKGALRANASEM